MPPTQVAEEFLEHYERQFDYYCQLSQLTGRLCEKWLASNAIRGIVTHRGKSPSSLREKLFHRAKWKDYQSFQDIYRDIIDLAGVRIALYFPNNLDDVDIILRKKMFIKKLISFPKDKPDKLQRFRSGFKRRNHGYVAKHYRAFLDPDQLDLDQHRFSSSIIEIQVASVLMHAWSEVEHDLVYKGQAGNLSYQELEILDEINGIVLKGEEALANLWKAGDHRLAIPKNHIANKYELSALLHQYVESQEQKDRWDINAGEMDLLMIQLKKTSNDTTEKLQNLLDQLPKNPDDSCLCRILINQLRVHTHSNGNGDSTICQNNHLGVKPSEL